MKQLSFIETPFWTVSELTRYLRDLLENDFHLQDVWIQGEVSNLSRPSSGHLYFTVKDASCSLRCVMWRSSVYRQAFVPREGEAIEVHGSVNVYEAGGQYQLYADLIRPAGEGLLYQEFLRLKARLEAEGLFAPERKRTIPPWPQRVGIVTSPTGAALQDMLHTLQRRYPIVEVFLAGTPVQGDEAPGGIVRALDMLNRRIQPDVILLARGGGSIEDLWAFNDERVARAIAASAAPVITGVGHETDYTIADFVSDLRAPTPTAAAELATPNRADLWLGLEEMVDRMDRAMDNAIDTHRWQLSHLQNRLMLRSPLARVRSDRQRLDEYSRRANTAVTHRLRLQHTLLKGLEQQLRSLNPAAILRRGYAAVTHPDGTPVLRVKQVQTGDTLAIRMHDGRIDVEARHVEDSGEAR